MAAGLADSRARAQALIAAGVVRVDGVTAAKPAAQVGPGAALAVVGDPLPYVSRGALKLRHALDVFGLDPRGAVALDLGASTGGFSQVLLAPAPPRSGRSTSATASSRPRCAPIRGCMRSRG